jgi:hypothetical protein
MPFRDPEQRRANAREYKRRRREAERLGRAPAPAVIDVSGSPVRLSARRWELACGLHTAAQPLTTCPVCACAAEETNASVAALMAKRGHHAATAAKSMATKIERYGSARHNAPPPKSNAVTLREARRAKAGAA